MTFSKAKQFLTALLFWCATQANAYESEHYTFDIEVLTEQSNIIWGFDFLPDGKILFSERSGALKLLNPKTHDVITIKNLPTILVDAEYGLLDVSVHPNFEQTHWIYLTHSVLAKNGKPTTALSRAELVNDSLKNVQVLFTAFENNTEGSRIVFDKKGHLFMSLGERNERDKVQSLGYHNGKIIRLNEDGSLPADNPFVNTANAKPEIWSLGHRNSQGLAFDKSGALWQSEFGPLGGDEINIIEAGKNYGWPVITYGREYTGEPIGEGFRKQKMEQPIIYYFPSLSPSGISFYEGNQYPKWRGNLFVAALSGQQLKRLVVEKNRVIRQEALLENLKWRFRHVREGKDGFLYFSTDSGKLARIVNSN